MGYRTQNDIWPGKIGAPHLTGISPRQRLFDRFDSSLEKPIIWVTGPPGSGKTTLVSNYAQSGGRTCLWYQLDRGDADLANFFYFLGLAVDKITEKSTRPMPLLTPEYYAGIPEFCRNFFAQLGKRLHASSLLVFDNSQEVPDLAPLFKVLMESVAMLPADTRIVFISRRSPPPPFARLQANQSITIIDWNDLQFTDPEFQEVFKTRHLPLPTTATSQHLHAKLNGWIAGLHLFMGSKTQASWHDALGPMENNEEIFNYFAGEVFDNFDPETQDFLLKTSILPYMTVAQAEFLTRNSLSGKILAALHQANTFTEKRRGHEPVYQFHQLFREFLLAKAAEKCAPAQYNELQKIAAKLLLATGEPGQGLDLLIRARDWTGLTAAVIAHAPALIQQGRHARVASWIRSCPPDFIETEPWLAFWLGVSTMPIDPLESRVFLEKAYPRFRGAGDISGTYRCWAAIVETYFMEWRRFAPLDKWLTEFYDLRSTWELPAGETDAKVTAAVLAAMLFRQPQHPEILFWLHRAEKQIYALGDNAMQRLATGQYVLLAYFWTGAFDKAEQLLPVLQLDASRQPLPPLIRIMWHAIIATHGWQTTDFAASVTAADHGLEMARASGIHVMNVHLLAQGIHAHLGEGNLAGAKPLLDKMAAVISENRPHDMATYYLLAGLNFSMRGEHQKALKFLGRAENFAIDAGVPFSRCLIVAGKGYVVAQLGRQKQALEYLDQALRGGREMGSAIMELMCLLYLAKVYFDLENETVALKFLADALALGREHDIYHWPVWDPAVCTFLCVTALKNNLEKDYVRQLIGKRRLYLTVPPLELEDWPWALRIYTMGRFSIIRDDQPVSLGSRGQQKPIVLLQALIALGGRNVDETRLADILWPDADGDLQLQTLRTNLHRLRRLIGSQEAIIHLDGQLTLNPAYCWVDTWAYERLLGTAETAWQQKQEEATAERAAGQAFSFYQGAFLPHKAGEYWTLFLRERLRRKYIISAELLGHHLEKQGRWQEAVHHYHKGLVVDHLVEAFHQRLMVCYLKLDRPTEAISTYQRCRAALASGIGIEPSWETTKIFQQIPRC